VCTPWRSLLLAAAAGLAACSSQPPMDGPKDAPAQADAAKPAALAPATVLVDDGVGFTVTETARMDSAVRATYREAMQALSIGNNERGITLLSRVIEQAPDATGPYVDLGIAHGKAGNDTEAVSVLESAVTATPDHPIAHNELGIAYRRVGRFADARRSYERALEIFPEFHFARRNLAVLCDLYLADLACAQAHYALYQSAVPDDANVNMWLADLQSRAAQGNKEGG
jgi:Flp pilus assembly protein TadD